MTGTSQNIKGGGGFSGGGGLGVVETALGIAAASYGYGMGKGLKEPCSPYREAYVFGAELNVPDAGGWNCSPRVVGSTSLFDLSTITPNHEVVVAILHTYNLSSAATVHHKWYRDRDGKLLFDIAYNIPDPGSYGYDYWAWYYVYSYIGYVPWEIYENGDYHVDLIVDGKVVKTFNFAVTGVVEQGQGNFELPYTEVTIEAPASAAAGETVPVTIKIRNKYYASVHVATIGIYDSEERFIDWLDYWIPAGETHSFPGSFVMPAKDVIIHAYSYYEAVDGGWYYDNEDEKPVSLEEVYAGTIIGIELEHDGVQEGLPVYNIPQGQTARVHVWGRNDMATAQRLGIGWIVTGPGGPDDIVERHEDDWSFLAYRQGADHKFSGDHFNLDKKGTYRLAIALYMNPADPVEVDSWEGTLCTVAAAVPEPEFRGFEVTSYV